MAVLQAKAGQAYDSAAQGAAQAKDYTQVNLLFARVAATPVCDKCCHISVGLLLTPWLSLQAKAGQAYDSAAQGTAQAKDYTQVGLHSIDLS